MSMEQLADLYDTEPKGLELLDRLTTPSGWAVTAMFLAICALAFVIWGLAGEKDGAIWAGGVGAFTGVLVGLPSATVWTFVFAALVAALGLWAFQQSMSGTRAEARRGGRVLAFSLCTLAVGALVFYLTVR